MPKQGRKCGLGKSFGRPEYVRPQTVSADARQGFNLENLGRRDAVLGPLPNGLFCNAKLFGHPKRKAPFGEQVFSEFALFHGNHIARSKNGVKRKKP